MRTKAAPREESRFFVRGEPAAHTRSDFFAYFREAHLHRRQGNKLVLTVRVTGDFRVFSRLTAGLTSRKFWRAWPIGIFSCSNADFVPSPVRHRAVMFATNERC